MEMLTRYNISEETIRIIGSFSILWCRFEQAFFENEAKVSLIKNWTEGYHFSERTNKLYIEIRDKANEYLEHVDEVTVRDRIYSRTNKGSNVDRDSILAFLSDYSGYNYTGCFLFINRIRDNMFHGLKDIYTLNQQQELFYAICKMLNAVLESENL